jgi:hypothetical protein
MQGSAFIKAIVALIVLAQMSHAMRTLQQVRPHNFVKTKGHPHVYKSLII